VLRKMSLKFGLGVPKKVSTTSQTKKPATKPVSAFSTDDDEGSSVVDPSSTTSKPSKKSKLPISQYGDLSAQQSYRKNTEKALEVDASIYDYDAAWDAMKAREEARKAADKEKAEQGKAKYMENLLKAKDVREKDYLRAKEKKYQRERETEGDEFAEKEKFVTGAYKKQQEDLRRQEEEEKKREKAELKRRDANGKHDFLNKLLEQGDRKHQGDVSAAADTNKSAIPACDPVDVKKTDVEIAKELNAKGANIALTDDGEIADKRQLLSAGLNVMSKPISVRANSNRTMPLSGMGNSHQGKTANSHAARERQSRMLEEQLEQMMKRQADEEAEEERQQEHAAKSRKTTNEISSARERYLERKRAAEAAATKGKQSSSS
jgi:coiled-coil domain-containing protein 55